MTFEIFDGKGAELSPESRGLAMKYFKVSDQELMGLCGALRRSQVNAKWVDKWDTTEVDDNEVVPTGLHIKVASEHIRTGGFNEFVLFQEPEQPTASLYFKLIDFITPGLGGALVQRVATQAQAAGLTRLRLQAAGGRLWPPRDDGSFWKGYASWPKYGFDMLLFDNKDKQAAWDISKHFPYVPQGLASCYSVHDVLSLERGREFWEVCGVGDYMEFDLAEESLSWECLNAWINKGKNMKKNSPPVPLNQQPAGFSAEQVPTRLGGLTPAQSLLQKTKRLTLAPLNTEQTAQSIRHALAHGKRKGAELLED